MTYNVFGGTLNPTLPNEAGWLLIMCVSLILQRTLVFRRGEQTLCINATHLKARHIGKQGGL